MNDRKNSVAIIGLGLLGGSLGMALRKSGCRRIGWDRRSEVRDRAIELEAVDQVFSEASEAAGAAELVVLALPVSVACEYLAGDPGFWRPGTLVTDIGSVKQPVMAAAAGLAAAGVTFVGSHPMAGTEKSGLEAAFPELYFGADVFVTPAPDSPPDAVARIETLWRSVGGIPGRIDPARHDDLVARTSHVLHVLASALASSILEAPDEETRHERFRGCATGFRDSCRIASSNPAMWKEIIMQNQQAVLAALRDFDRRYAELKHLIEIGDFDGFENEFARGKQLRDRWLEYKSGQRNEQQRN